LGGVGLLLACLLLLLLLGVFQVGGWGVVAHLVSFRSWCVVTPGLPLPTIFWFGVCGHLHGDMRDSGAGARPHGREAFGWSP
ncbi:hypothetical protein QP291_25975, partial [Escherichia coli]|nr:hypothetical protein [Escherichia coli]